MLSVTKICLCTLIEFVHCFPKATAADTTVVHIDSGDKSDCQTVITHLFGKIKGQQNVGLNVEVKTK